MKKPRGPFGVAAHSGPFAQVPALLLFDKRISAEAKIVYAALASHADENSYCFPRQLGLAAALGIKQHTLSYHLSTLAQYQWIIPGWTVVDGRRRRSYTLNWKPPRIDGVDTNKPPRIDGVDIDGVDIDGVDAKNISIRREQTTRIGESVSALELIERTEKRPHTKTAQHTVAPLSYEQWLAQRDWIAQRNYDNHPDWGHDAYQGYCAARGWEPQP